MTGNQLSGSASASESGSVFRKLDSDSDPDTDPDGFRFSIAVRAAVTGQQHPRLKSCRPSGPKTPDLEGMRQEARGGCSLRKLSPDYAVDLSSHIELCGDISWECAADFLFDPLNHCLKIGDQFFRQGWVIGKLDRVETEF